MKIKTSKIISNDSITEIGNSKYYIDIISPIRFIYTDHKPTRHVMFNCAINFDKHQLNNRQYHTLRGQGVESFLVSRIFL